MNSTDHSGEVLERRGMVLVQGIPAGFLWESVPGFYRFEYLPEYHGSSVSLTIPNSRRVWEYRGFPPFFEGLSTARGGIPQLWLGGGYHFPIT